MPSFRGKALIPSQFFFRHLLPLAIDDAASRPLIGHAVRKYLGAARPERDQRVAQISLRVNEVCNLRCRSCGQWGENGHLARKLADGGKLDALDFEVVKRVVQETLPDRPVYYVWGGEPTLWKPLVPLFEELGRHRLRGSLVSNAHALLPLLEPLVETEALSILFLSLDGWDSASQNSIRTPAGSGSSDNFEKTMAVMERLAELKAKKRRRAPLVVPITVISGQNQAHLADIHRLVLKTSQLHPYYYGWFITEERAALHEKVFAERFGFEPRNHRGYLKSCFDDVDPRVVAAQVAELRRLGGAGDSVPQLFPDLETEAQIARYYRDHAWDCGYPSCESIYHLAEINPDGRVTPCRDYQDFEAGNVNTTPFYEIWNGEAFKRFRREMKKGLMPVCTRCCGLQGF